MTKNATGWRQVFLLVSLLAMGVAESSASSWPDWDRFTSRFMQADGRIIDITFEGKSTSEGQSYALFFALVADRRDQFDTILKWTADNMADGQLGQKLPGWLWGKRDDGSWGIKDRNMASDADLWLAYSLLEAGRLWNEPRYTKLGRDILALVAKLDVVKAGKSGVLLLPGPVGFDLGQGRYRINPSYLPGFMFHYFASVDSRGPWAGIWNSYVRLAPKLYAKGVAPDNVVVDTKGNVFPDSERTPFGSYDAIRVYLWAGMSGDLEKERVSMLAPFAKLIRTHGMPPEKVSPESGSALKYDWSPPGFAGAVLPFLESLGDKQSLSAQSERIAAAAKKASQGEPTHYYDQVLTLFGKGWHDGYYRFDAAGRLQPKWVAQRQLAAVN